jgi:hypothetical protein
MAEAGITAEDVLQAVARIAFFDPGRLLKANGTPKNLADIDAHALSGAALTVTATFSGACACVLRSAGKMSALELLGRYHKLWD